MNKILSIGAEAILIKTKWFAYEAVEKIRLPKLYRNSALDLIIRKKRTINEARLIFEAHKIGVATPVFYDVNLRKPSIVMEFIDGKLLRDIMKNLDKNRIRKIFSVIGKYTALLHLNGITHGDLTTSNIIVNDKKVYIIDFGLGSFSRRIEDMGVDIHLLLRSLEFSNIQLSKIAFYSFLMSYKEIMREKSSLIINKVKEIRLRGRYISNREPLNL